MLPLMLPSGVVGIYFDSPWRLAPCKLHLRCPPPIALDRPPRDEGVRREGMTLLQLVNGADSQLRRLAPKTSRPRPRTQKQRRLREEGAPQLATPRSSGGVVPAGSLWDTAGWVVACKPLVRGQLTLEQAARVTAAVRMLRSSGELPSIICFCGGDLIEQPNRPTVDSPLRSYDIDQRSRRTAIVE